MLRRGTAMGPCLGMPKAARLMTRPRIVRAMKQPKKPHVRRWYLRESRKLHGVEPPTTLKVYLCAVVGCDETKQTEENRGGQ